MTAWEEWETLQHHTRSSHCHVIMLVIAMNLYDFRAAGGIDFADQFHTDIFQLGCASKNLCMERRVAVKLHAKTCSFALGLTLSAALAGCSGSEQANTPAGGTNAIPPRTPSPGPGTAHTKADRPEITEKPAEPTPTPKEATPKGGADKGGVKKEEPPKGS
jgi:hypothetical protein